MKKFAVLATLLLSCGWLHAQVTIERVPLGSGTPGMAANGGAENAVQWDLDIYHAPQYMPGYPTAASIFPRAVPVLCVKQAASLHCKGYQWLADMGRTEYLMIRPVLVKEFPSQ
ncbi:MAG: hypothetical protein JWR60_606 [Polaromonas sp.]|nr:hypothetical protein [Polaromonas sp.]